MNRTNIEYLTHTSNPIVGCSGIGCAVVQNCWAHRMAKRQKHRCKSCYNFIPHVHFNRFDEPLHRKIPSRIGIAFMGEFYDRLIPEWVRASLMIKMKRAYWHFFMILTKQPQNIDLDEPIPKNVCVGVSVNRNSDLWRVDALRKVDVKMNAISFEPLYEDLRDIDLKGIKWIIIGAQTRPNVQPKKSWVANLLEKADDNHTLVFLKNNLGWGYRKEKIESSSRHKI